MKLVSRTQPKLEVISRPNPNGEPARLYYGVVIAPNRTSSQRSTRMIWQRVQFDQITKRYTAGWLAGQSPEEMDAAIAVSEVIEGRAVTRDALKGELLPYKIGNDYALKYTCFVDEGVDEDKAFAAAGHPAPTTSKDTVIALAHGLINAGLARVSAATAGEQDQLAELQSLVAAPKSEFKGALAPKVK